jgi:hypothetical protein
MAKYSTRQLLLATSVAAAGLVLVACPGTDRMTAPPGNQIVTDTLSAVLQATGYVQTGQEGSGQMAQAFPGWPSVVGDFSGNVNGTAVRGQIGFDLTGLPQGITVQGATLTAYQCAVNGDPIGNLGDVIVRHMSYPVPFDTTVFFKTALDSTVDTLSTSDALGPRSIIVTSSVVSDLGANRTASQYQLQMSSVDLEFGQSDNAVFSADSANMFGLCPAVAGQQPRLIIVYRAPT